MKFGKVTTNQQSLRHFFFFKPAITSFFGTRGQRQEAVNTTLTYHMSPFQQTVAYEHLSTSDSCGRHHRTHQRFVFSQWSRLSRSAGLFLSLCIRHFLIKGITERVCFLNLLYRISLNLCMFRGKRMIHVC